MHPVKLSAAFQNGAALLGFMLIIVLGLTYLLIRDLNQNVEREKIGVETNHALYEAKLALLSWAVNHPAIPGALPMPDRNGDSDYDGDSDCFNGTIGNNLLLGKIPWRDVTSPCKDAASLSGLKIFSQDSSGETLWYAVSKNLVYEPPEYPLISISILNKTTDWISVYDSGGGLISDRVAFVVIAPGSTLGGQDRSGNAPNVNNFLDSVTVGGKTFDHADTTDMEFIIYPNSNLTAVATDDFNDRLVFVTVDELMQGVVKRVLNETGNLLTAYHNSHNALPWLSPYADPKAVLPTISGEVDNATVSTTTLEDSGIDFVAAGIQAGDLVRNITDNSFGVVNAVGTPDALPDDNTLTVLNLVLGDNNNFGDGDEYYIIPQSSTYVSSILSGTATSNSSGLILEDSGKDFTEIGIAPGDVIENVTDGSSGVIAEVTSTTLTVTALSGGTENDFDDTETYRIRSNIGIATGGSSGLILEDTNKNFTTMGITVGDFINNVTDGSLGRVTATTATTITVDKLRFGTENDFDVSDIYKISRFNPISGTNEGHLAFYDIGEFFATTFNVDWSITVNAADVSFDSIAFPSVQAAYSTGMENQVSIYAANGTVSFNVADGSCIWFAADTAECFANQVVNINISGTATSGTNTSVLTDSNADFSSAGVKRGDIVQNYDDEFALSPGVSGTADTGSNGTTLYDAGTNFNVSGVTAYQHLIHNNTTGIRGVITEIVDDNTITAVEFDNQPSGITFSPGDGFTIYTPGNAIVTSLSSSTVANTTRASVYNPDFDGNLDEYYRIITAAASYSGQAGPTSSGSTLVDGGSNFIAQGVAVGDTIENIDDGSFGEITGVTATTITATLYGGSGNTFNNNDDYVIYHDYTYSRVYEWRPRLRGNSQVNTVAEERVRDVCMGYSTDCTTVSTAVAFSGNGGVPLITARDYEADGSTEVGRTEFAPSASSSGSLRLSNVDFNLAEKNNDIPDWFVRNKWHQYVYVVYSDGDLPGAASICTPGTDCLELTIGSSNKNNIRALAMITAEELATQSWSNSLIDDYFDDTENTDGDRFFIRLASSNTFNDKLRVAVSCPSASTLCWSN